MTTVRITSRRSVSWRFVACPFLCPDKSELESYLPRERRVSCLTKIEKSISKRDSSSTVSTFMVNSYLLLYLHMTRNTFVSTDGTIFYRRR